jgi:hypothetical protein
MKEHSTRIMLAIVILLQAALLVQNSRGVSAESQRVGNAAPVIRASAFEVVDVTGQVRAQLYLGDDGDGGIRLRNKHGALRVKLGASADGLTGLQLFDEAISDQNPAVALVTSRSEGTSLLLKEKGKEKRIRPD